MNKKRWIITAAALAVVLAAVSGVYATLTVRENKEKSRQEAIRETEKKEQKTPAKTTEKKKEPVTAPETPAVQQEEIPVDNPEPAAAEPVQNGYCVAIDPGHQGGWVDMSTPEPVAPGASETKPRCSTGTAGAYSGLNEYELTLSVSLALRDELNARGYRTIMTREDNDANISNAERAQMAYTEGGNIYVRIHANGVDDPSVSGALSLSPTEGNPYVGDLAGDSLRLGSCILDSYCLETGLKNRGIQYSDSMTGINWSRIPVTILEMGFMSNESDDLSMADPEFQKRMVKGIADGIDSYFQK